MAEGSLGRAACGYRHSLILTVQCKASCIATAVLFHCLGPHLMCLAERLLKVAITESYPSYQHPSGQDAFEAAQPFFACFSLLDFSYAHQLADICSGNAGVRGGRGSGSCLPAHHTKHTGLPSPVPLPRLASCTKHAHKSGD